MAVLRLRSRSCLASSGLKKSLRLRLKVKICFHYLDSKAYLGQQKSEVGKPALAPAPVSSGPATLDKGWVKKKAAIGFSGQVLVLNTVHTVKNNYEFC